MYTRMTTRRNFSDQFKAAVALEALRGDKTVQEIASKRQLYPTQVSTWKQQAIEGMANVFLDKVTCAPKTPPNLCRVLPTKGRTNEGTIYRRTDHRDDQRAGIW